MKMKKQNYIIRTKQYVDNCIPEYLKFMNIDTMPDFDVDVLKNKSPDLHTSHKSKVPVIQIPEMYTTLLKENAKPGIYHEFTHIVDHASILINMPIEQQNKYLRWYTEYHATQVQMKKSLRFNSYYDEYHFKTTTTVHDWLDNKTVKEDIKFKTDEYVDKIKELYRSKNSYRIMLHSIYYLSQIQFWRAYCSESIENLIDWRLISAILGHKEIEVLLEQLRNPNVSDVRYFIKLKNIMDDISVKIAIKLG